MFHVKQSFFIEFFEQFKKSITCQSAVEMPLELLLFLLRESNCRAVVCVEDHAFSDVFHNYSYIYRGVDFLPPLCFFDRDTPVGFKSNANEHRGRVLSKLSVGEISNIIISTKRGISEKSIKQNHTKFINFDTELDYEELVNFLSLSSYEPVETVTKCGEYVLKGGIVDVYPFNKTYPVRFSFLSESVSVYRFDVESQITDNPVLLRRIADRHMSGESSVLDVVGEKFKIINHKATNLVEGCVSISFNLFDKDFSNTSLKVLPKKNLTNNGYVFLDQILVPRWFLSRTTSLEKPDMADTIDFKSLAIKDRVVHKHHGVCEYGGLYDFGDKGVFDERLLLEFLDGGRIYVSTQNLGLIEYHSSKEEPAFKLDSLSKKGVWQKKKRLAKKQVDDIVDDLLKNYASRSISKKNLDSFDYKAEKRFIKSFPFEETLDQTQSWKEVSKDLEDKKPMDRLLCGDVGFGKTEIALRAAFKVVYSGKQVALLAPTTILANQHFHTFIERLSPFSINVGLVSSFKNKSENKSTLEKLKNNMIDVVIGTHSLLSPGVGFYNLGLLVVDEEHRFGVKQKEKIVDIKNDIDVLSMSATPIPRTLHMSLSGIKNISTINTPPKARFPINTQVQYYDIENIKSIIMFEVGRKGQVFFIHNNIKTLENIVSVLRDVLPGLKINFAHGQEQKKSLERKMSLFIEGKTDVLVCTSIIETGIDIPNVNTVIINRAHLFGLSQLYQIRGRVGRSDRQAFAYLMIPKGYRLSKNAYKRLKSIEKNTSLGSGYNISKSDMEIRGVGSIFGYKQSGGLSQIGYGLYSKLIKESLEDKNFVKKSFIIDPEDISVKLYIDMAIPLDYISSESIRLEFYRKLSQCDKLDHFMKIKYELENRFGPQPNSVKNLIDNYKARIYCAKLGIKSCVYSDGILQLVFLSAGVSRSIDSLIPFIVEFCAKRSITPKFLPGDREALLVNISLNKNLDIYTFLESILNKLTTLILM